MGLKSSSHAVKPRYDVITEARLNVYVIFGHKHNLKRAGVSVVERLVVVPTTKEIYPQAPHRLELLVLYLIE